MAADDRDTNGNGATTVPAVVSDTVRRLIDYSAGSVNGSNGHGAKVVDLRLSSSATAPSQARPAPSAPLLPPDFNLHEALLFTCRPSAQVDGNTVKISIHFCVNLDRALVEQIRFFVRWGSYDDIPDRWTEVRVRPREFTQDESGQYSLHKILRVYKRGRYGATVYATCGDGAQKVWQGRPEVDDAKFTIDSDSSGFICRLMRVRRLYRKEVEKLVQEKLADLEEADIGLDKLRVTPTLGRLSRVVFDCSRESPKWRSLLSRYYEESVRRLQSEQTDELKAGITYVVKLLDSIGLGDVVLVAPEGPHAAAGGLAQVMNGLLKALSRHGIPVTLVSPLYEFSQGAVHRSAEEVLREGVELDGRRLPLKWVGEVDVPFGPTTQRGTSHWRQHAHKARAVVYQAEADQVRLLLFRNARYADYLYPTVWADEQLRRAVFISRGALEILKNPLFGVHPQLIISNDWLTALVPVFHKLDLRYSCDENLRDSKTVHLLHNCGRDYHGCIPFTFNNQDLWPMLELDPLHAFGMRDPQNPALMNLTAGAIFHLNGALLAVSKPYAQQLLTWDGSGGLSGLVADRRGAVFGISNGIDQKSLRRKIVEIGERSMAKLDIAPPPRPTDDGLAFLDNLAGYKRAAKLVIQKDLGLDQDEHRTLISFVGRLVEQKGIQLLMNWGTGENISVMESILLRHPEVQFVVAGPQVDTLSRTFRGLVEYLCWKYRGRVAGIYNFIPHEYALEVFTASDFYLMPSRFEPGGLTQLEALSCGTLVIARNVGGLAATLTHVDDPSGCGNAFLFNDYTSSALRETISWAINSTRDPNWRRELMLRSARAEHDWEHRVPQYVALFQHIAGVLDVRQPYDHLQGRMPILECLRP